MKNAFKTVLLSLGFALTGFVNTSLATDVVTVSCGRDCQEQGSGGNISGGWDMGGGSGGDTGSNGNSGGTEVGGGNDRYTKYLHCMSQATRQKTACYSSTYQGNNSCVATFEAQKKQC